MIDEFVGRATKYIQRALPILSSWNFSVKDYQTHG